jgi:hypothetical protein
VTPPGVPGEAIEVTVPHHRLRTHLVVSGVRDRASGHHGGVHLHAAFVPPARLQDALTSLVRAQEPPPPEPEPPAPERRGLLGRRSVEPPPPPEPAGPLLDVVGADLTWIPITDFGFVRPSIARELGEAIERAAQRYEPPRVVLTGGSALLDEDDRNVWVEVTAEADGLEVMRGIAREVVAAVEPLGFYCDRRQFRSRIPVATINERTSVEHLEVVLAALDAFASDVWTVDEFAVLQRGIGTYRTVPIGA